MTTRAECIAKAAEEPKMQADWVLVPREPTEAMVVAGVVANQERMVADVYAAMLAAAPSATAPEEAELRARDAAPIVGERETLAEANEHMHRKYGGDGHPNGIPAWWAEHEGFTEGWSARAALPSGGGAREAAEEIAADLRAAPITHDIAGVKQAHVSVEALPTAVDRWAAIITKHIPSAPAGLTEEERGAVEKARAFLAQHPFPYSDERQLYDLLAIIDRLEQKP